VRAGAGGSPADREELARRYLPVVRAYLSARWRGSTWREHLDDATQEVFVECFRQGGALEAAGAGKIPQFRAFLYGVVRNIARRFESRSQPAGDSLSDLEAKDPTLSQLFDRTWAESIMVDAARLQKSRAVERGAEAVQRVELLRLRFEEDLPIRAIAERWNVEPAKLHHAYAEARQEFREALLAVVAFHSPGSAAELEREATELLQALS
jgi:RNA polymerase sigma factor (sigma-70 family)